MYFFSENTTLAVTYHSHLQMQYCIVLPLQALFLCVFYDKPLDCEIVATLHIIQFYSHHGTYLEVWFQFMTLSKCFSSYVGKQNVFHLFFKNLQILALYFTLTTVTLISVPGSETQPTNPDTPLKCCTFSRMCPLFTHACKNALQAYLFTLALLIRFYRAKGDKDDPYESALWICTLQ